MIKRKHVLTLMLLLTGLAGMLSSCRHNPPNTPPPSPAVATVMTLLDASNTCVTVEDGLTAANHTIEQLEASEPEYYAKVKPLLQKISSANVAAARKVKVVKDTGAGDWKPAMLAVAQSVNISDLNAAQIKNPTSQKIAAASLASLISILSTISQNLGGTK